MKRSAGERGALHGNRNIEGDITDGLRQRRRNRRRRRESLTNGHRRADGTAVGVSMIIRLAAGRTRALLAGRMANWKGIGISGVAGERDFESNEERQQRLNRDREKCKPRAR